jgi:hypothetical protein
MTAIETMVKERGIPFSDEMIQAWVAGKKTQTRRLAKINVGPDHEVISLKDLGDGQFQIQFTGNLWYHEKAKYGGPGGRLWFRENLINDDFRVAYSSDKQLLTEDADTWVGAAPISWIWQRDKLSARYCPRWAARHFAEIVEVRLQRVQDISREDIEAEGTSPEPGYTYPRKSDFKRLWNSLHDKPGERWDDNPFVFAYTLKKIEPEPGQKAG